MSKRKERREKAALFARVRGAAQAPAKNDNLIQEHDSDPVMDRVFAASEHLAPLAASKGRRKLPLMKKFRFQLLHAWIVTHLPPCRVADVGGGKGLLAYLLQESGWQATVVDPVSQDLPAKFKDLSTNRQTRIPNDAAVPHWHMPFVTEMAQDFELLVAMHAHGCNVQLIHAAAEYGREAILLPCCVIGEPLVPPPGVHWIQALIDIALQDGLKVEPFRLNFKGQNIGLYLKPAYFS